jgi:hypothetical protein
MAYEYQAPDIKNAFLEGVDRHDKRKAAESLKAEKDNAFARAENMRVASNKALADPSAEYDPFALPTEMVEKIEKIKGTKDAEYAKGLTTQRVKLLGDVMDLAKNSKDPSAAINFYKKAYPTLAKENQALLNPNVTSLDEIDYAFINDIELLKMLDGDGGSLVSAQEKGAQKRADDDVDRSIRRDESQSKVEARKAKIAKDKAVADATKNTRAIFEKPGVSKASISANPVAMAAIRAAYEAQQAFSETDEQKKLIEYANKLGLLEVTGAMPAQGESKTTSQGVKYRVVN